VTTCRACGDVEDLRFLEGGSSDCRVAFDECPSPNIPLLRLREPQTVPLILNLIPLRPTGLACCLPLGILSGGAPGLDTTNGVEVRLLFDDELGARDEDD